MQQREERTQYNLKEAEIVIDLRCNFFSWNTMLLSLFASLQASKTITKLQA